MPSSPFLAPERDDPSKPGRARAGSGGSIDWVSPGMALTSVNTFSLTSGADYYAPVLITSPVLVDQLGFEVTTAEAAKNARVGLYRADLDWQPIGAPLIDSGDISLATTGVKTYSPSPVLYLPRGRYLSVMNNNATTAALRRWEGAIPGSSPVVPNMGLSSLLSLMAVVRAYAAFPTPGTPWTDQTNAGQTPFRVMVLLRVSAL